MCAALAESHSGQLLETSAHNGTRTHRILSKGCLVFYLRVQCIDLGFYHAGLFLGSRQFILGLRGASLSVEPVIAVPKYSHLAKWTMYAHLLVPNFLPSKHENLRSLGARETPKDLRNQ
jgi:hypothetical protein